MTNIVRALLSMLLGNLAYFALMPYLPANLQHLPYRIDWGLFVDLIVCLAIFLSIRAIAGRTGPSVP